MALQMITANRLTDGAVVFLAGDERWVERFEEGRLIGDEAESAALQQAVEAAVARAEVVGPYLIEVSEQSGRLLPARYRERIRVQGPSVGGKLVPSAEAR